MARQTISIQLLGGFRVTVGSQAIGEDRWRRRKASALVKILALAPDQRLHREQLLELLWPALSPAQAANSFHQALYLARRILDPADDNPTRWLRLQDEFLLLAPHDSLWIDVQAFEQAAAAARRHREVAAYRNALDLYTGELLPQDRYEEWALARRDALQQEYLALLAALAELYQAGYSYESAIETCQQLVRVEPTREEAYRQLIELYALTGRREQALQGYQRLRETLQRELEVEPAPATQELYRRILSGELRQVEAKPAAPRDNLPVALTSFIGRERAKDEVKRSLAGARLVTLTGPGGCGKTRLALQVAQEVLPQFREGVWLVELAALSDAAEVPRAIASAVGVTEQAGYALTETLKQALRSKQLLVVLDNCEHLVQACAELAHDLLTHCRELQILATSREPLHILGENVWLVPSLSLPNIESLPAFQDLPDYEAVRLFVERASAARSAFGLSPENGPAVARLCYRLDGIPLAIELAAARVNVLSPEQLLARLDDRFRLLTSGNRAALNRQQTLRATMDWSYDLLSAGERVLFRRLAVFASGGTLEAIESVCAVMEGDASSRLAPGEVLDLLTQLVDRSLVAVEPPRAEPRYHMLETIREYARERLAQAREERGTGARHLAWYLELTEQANSGFWSQAHLEWVERLERDHDNLRAALAWALEHDPQAGLKLATALWQFWILRGYLSEADRTLTNLLRKLPRHSSLQASALLAAVTVKVRSGYNPAAAALIQASLAIYGELGDRAGMSQAMQLLGAVAFVQGEFREARSRFESSVRLARETGETHAIALATHFLGMTHAYLGELQLAQRLMEAGLGLFEQLGDAPNLTMLFVNFGGGGMYGEPVHWWLVDEETVVLLRRVSAQAACGYGLANLGRLAHMAGKPGESHTLLEQGLALFNRLGDLAGSGQVLNQLGYLASASRRFAEASSYFEASLAVRRTLGERRGIGRTLGGMANLAILQGNFERADTLLDECLHLFREMGDKPGLAATLNQLGNLALARGDSAGAEELHRQTVEHFSEFGKRSATALLNWAETARARGDEVAARSRLQASLRLFQEMGDRVGQATASALLRALGE